MLTIAPTPTEAARAELRHARGEADAAHRHVRIARAEAGLPAGAQGPLYRALLDLHRAVQAIAEAERTLGSE